MNVRTPSLNRLSPYIALRKSGFAPEEAAKRVMAAQVDYGDVTEWEQKQRPLSTVSPDIGRTVENFRQWAGGEKQKPTPFISQEFEHLARNTPFSRYFSTGRKVTDKEKMVQNMVSAITGVSVD